jgi:hypothetical protein
MQTKATYDSTGGTFTLVKDRWQVTFRISALPSWLDFYRQQQQRYPSGSYDDDVKALEVLATEISSSSAYA